MPAPTRPGVLPIWTVGNSGVRQQPTNGEQFTGFFPNFRPPAGWHNWLFGVTSDWLAWLDYSTQSLGAYQETPAGAVDGVNATFLLSQVPKNATSIQVYLDGLIINKSLWTFTAPNIIFSTPPAVSQDVYVSYLINS